MISARPRFLMVLMTSLLSLPVFMGAQLQGCNDTGGPIPDGPYAGYSPWVFAPKYSTVEYTLEASLESTGGELAGSQDYLVYNDYRANDFLCTLTESFSSGVTNPIGDTSSCEGCSLYWKAVVTPGATDCTSTEVEYVFGRDPWEVRSEVWGGTDIAAEGVPSAWSSISDELLAMGAQYTLWIYDTNAAPGAFYPYYVLIPGTGLVSVGPVAGTTALRAR